MKIVEFHGEKMQTFDPERESGNREGLERCRGLKGYHYRSHIIFVSPGKGMSQLYGVFRWDCEKGLVRIMPAELLLLGSIAQAQHDLDIFGRQRGLAAADQADVEKARFGCDG
ncbi:MAG: hypothetical protein MUF10_17305 [Thermoanaerobaculaceae bacterium]|nr:hypothetical protein [Thermoanaerobaculaceae bacterium]